MISGRDDLSELHVPISTIYLWYLSMLSYFIKKRGTDLN
jgi:hypothetical protein